MADFTRIINATVNRYLRGTDGELDKKLKLARQIFPIPEGCVPPKPRPSKPQKLPSEMTLDQLDALISELEQDREDWEESMKDDCDRCEYEFCEQDRLNALQGERDSRTSILLHLAMLTPGFMSESDKRKDRR